MRKINEAKSILILNKTIIDKLSFERFSDDIDKIDEDSKINFNHKISQIGKFDFRVSLGVVLMLEGQYNIEAQISGFFSVDEQSVLGKKVLENNTAAILFPYLRSQLTLLTSQPGFEPVILPVMNINALMRDEN